MKANLVALDAALVAEVRHFCEATDADLTESLNEAIRDYLESSVAARLHFHYKRKGMVMANPFLSDAHLVVQ